jgi:hypothetical protein
MRRQSRPSFRSADKRSILAVALRQLPGRLRRGPAEKRVGVRRGLGARALARSGPCLAVRPIPERLSPAGRLGSWAMGQPSHLVATRLGLRSSLVPRPSRLAGMLGIAALPAGRLPPGWDNADLIPSRPSAGPRNLRLDLPARQAAPPAFRLQHSARASWSSPVPSRPGLLPALLRVRREPAQALPPAVSGRSRDSI